MSGASAWAAVTAPRRLNSSCTEKTKCDRRPPRLGGESARDLDHHSAAGAIVDGGPGDALAGESSDLGA